MRPSKRPASALLLGLLLFGSVACTSPETAVQLRFASTWDGAPIDCDSAPISLSDLRFFVSNVRLLDTEGREHVLTMSDEPPWQQQHVALIDLENGNGACLNGSADMAATLSGTIESDAVIQGVRFTVGVPFELNHANPLLAEAPLDQAAMHWHWRSGYKFMRAGVASETDGFWMHLGSTACAGTVQNITSCAAPNRVDVALNDFSPRDNIIEVSLSALFTDVDLSDGVASDCSSGPAEDACVAPFSALGLVDADARTLNVFRTLR